MTDPVNRPAHYQGSGGLEAITVIEAFGLGYRLGNAVKYILRAGRKGDRVTDLQKARWYLDREIGDETGGAVAEGQAYRDGWSASRFLCASTIEALAIDIRDNGWVSKEGLLTGMAGAQVGVLLDAAASLRALAGPSP